MFHCFDCSYFTTFIPNFNTEEFIVGFFLLLFVYFLKYSWFVILY